LICIDEDGKRINDFIWKRQKYYLLKELDKDDSEIFYLKTVKHFADL
jgi:hypothetical protein